MEGCTGTAAHNIHGMNVNDTIGHIAPEKVVNGAEHFIRYSVDMLIVLPTKRKYQIWRFELTGHSSHARARTTFYCIYSFGSISFIHYSSKFRPMHIKWPKQKANAIQSNCVYGVRSDAAYYYNNVSMRADWMNARTVHSSYCLDYFCNRNDFCSVSISLLLVSSTQHLPFSFFQNWMNLFFIFVVVFMFSMCVASSCRVCIVFHFVCLCFCDRKLIFARKCGDSKWNRIKSMLLRMPKRKLLFGINFRKMSTFGSFVWKFCGRK